MMVIYGKVFQAARARIHKKRFRSQPQQHREDEQQQQQTDVDAGVDAGQIVSSASDGNLQASPDDAGGDSILSLSASDGQVLGTTVTLTVFPCDDVDATSLDGGPPQAVSRPTRLALRDPDRNGFPSPSESLETPSRPAHFLATTLKNSPSPSLRGSWLDLTKQFIMDRRKCLSPKTKVGACFR